MLSNDEVIAHIEAALVKAKNEKLAKAERKVAEVWQIICCYRVDGSTFLLNIGMVQENLRKVLRLQWHMIY